MRQLSPLDAQFLNVESPTTVGHVGSLIVLDPMTAPDGVWNLDTVRAVFEPRLHLAAPLRQRLVEVPLGLGRPYWVDDPHFDVEFHLRELALPSPGTQEQLGEQVARLHSRQLDRSRPLWEAYVITGLEGGRSAFYSKIHHAAIDGVSGAEILETIMDITVEPRLVPPEDAPFIPRPMPSTANLVGRVLRQSALNPVGLLATVPQSLQYVDQLPGAGNVPGTRLVSSAAGLVGRALGGAARPELDGRQLKAPRTPLNGAITPHRRFSFGSLPMSDVKLVKNHFGMTVNDVVMALTASALRRWLLDHDALPQTPLVAAVPVSVRTEDQRGSLGNQVSVMLAELPTHIGDPEERMVFMRSSMLAAKRKFNAVPASLLQDLSALVPTALSGLAARALFKLATVPGVIFNLFVSNVPGPQLPLYIAGARVQGIYPVSAVTDLTGGLNITLFSYDGSLDFGLIACREMVPDVWSLIGYLEEAMSELVALVPSEAPSLSSPPGSSSAASSSAASSSAATTGKSAAATTKPPAAARKVAATARKAAATAKKSSGPGGDAASRKSGAPAKRSSAPGGRSAAAAKKSSPPGQNSASTRKSATAAKKSSAPGGNSASTSKSATAAKRSSAPGGRAAATTRKSASAAKKSSAPGGKSAGITGKSAAAAKRSSAPGGNSASTRKSASAAKKSSAPGGNSASTRRSASAAKRSSAPGGNSASTRRSASAAKRSSVPGRKSAVTAQQSPASGTTT